MKRAISEAARSLYESTDQAYNNYLRSLDVLYMGVPRFCTQSDRGILAIANAAHDAGDKGNHFRCRLDTNFLAFSYKLFTVESVYDSQSPPHPSGHKVLTGSCGDCSA